MRLKVSIADDEFTRLYRILNARGRRAINARTEALSPVADMVASAIASRAPVSSRVHYRYRKGQGRVAEYHPGNLKRSVQRMFFPRSRDPWVGAKLSKGSPTGVFTGSRVDGYYAHFIEYGTIHTPPRPFFAPALATISPQALSEAVRIMKTLIEKK